MLNFKILFKKYALFFLFGCLITALISLGTFSGLGDSDLGTSSYLSALHKKTGKDILITAHCDGVSAFALPGTQFELRKGNIGITHSYVISEITEETFEEHIFSIGEQKCNLNMISYVSVENEKNISDFFGLSLLKGELVDDLMMKNSFYISEKTADYFVDNISYITSYDELLQNKISFKGQDFSILGIFSNESSRIINQTFDSIHHLTNSSFTNDFIISPYYLMNGGYFSNHNSLVLMLYGNETVFYHYLNYMSSNWKYYPVKTTLFSYGDNIYQAIDINTMPIVLFSKRWISIVSLIISIIFLIGTFYHLWHFWRLNKASGDPRIYQYFCLIFGIVFGAVLLLLINGKMIGSIFLYFCNYLFIIAIIIVFIVLTMLCLTSNSWTSCSNYNYYSVEI